MPDRISVAFALVADLGIALGAAPLTRWVGCWEHRLSDRWTIAVNGHRTTMATADGLDVPPCHALVVRDGWPVGLLTPFGGEMAGYGSDMEDELIAELESAIARACVAPVSR